MNPTRIKIFKAGILLGALIVTTRLFYLQVIRSSGFRALAAKQYESALKIHSQRGKILASDAFPLAYSLPSYTLFVDPKELNISINSLSEKIVEFLHPDATPPALIIEARKLQDQIDSNKSLRYVSLANNLTPRIKNSLTSLNLAGIGFTQSESRAYPEASAAAHLLGFMGKDESGSIRGYFGLEGFYDLDLSSVPGNLTREFDPTGNPITVGDKEENLPFGGRNIQTSIDRYAQYIAQKQLAKGLEKYGAKSGTVTIMEPATGRILAMASFPAYDQSDYPNYDPTLYKNPVISEAYEPGSTFKVLVVAAALNESLITPQTACPICSGPHRIDKYTIKTWNDKYYPNSTVSDIIQHSDNVGMVYIADILGTEKFLKYYKLFGFTTPSGIDLQEESQPLFKPDGQWTYIDRSTASFGQGISVTPIQMVRAVATIAANGILVTPRLVDKVIDGNSAIELPLKPGKKVLSPKVTSQVKEMMINAVDNGESKWAKPKGFKIAGKTGTAQIPVAGHYDEEKTIASFVGFAPADEPKFVMLVTLREPSTSQWGSETAAPLWFSIAGELFRLWNINP